MTVTVRGVSKSFGGAAVLNSVDLTLSTGVTCLMAPSGAGKTTLTRILLGLERPDSGTVTGLEGARLSAVFQEDRLLDRLDAEGNLRFVLGGAYDPARAAALLRELGLDGARKRPAAEYSGGMRRRLALARALSVPFDFLALDEPFTGLDAVSRAGAIDCIRRRTEGKTVLLVTHERSDAEGLNARIVTLQRP